jgi:hypothetical protein
MVVSSVGLLQATNEAAAFTPRMMLQSPADGIVELTKLQ